MQLSDRRNEGRMYSFPTGDFDALAVYGNECGVRPKWEEEAQVIGTPEGIVLEFINHLVGKVARSNAIPWEMFELSKHGTI